MRVNARLDDEARTQIEYLTTATGLGVSQVVRESVAVYYRQVRSREAGIANLQALIGKGQSGRTDIAGNVKAHLDQGFGRKR